MDVDITDLERKEYMSYHSAKDFTESMERGLSALEDQVKSFSNKKIALICGAMVAFDKGTISLLNEWAKIRTDLCLLSEVTAENRRFTKNKVSFPFICTPHLLAKEIVLLDMDVPLQLAVKCG